MKHINKNPSPEAFELWKEQFRTKDGYSLQELYNQESITGDILWRVLRSSRHHEKLYSKQELREALLVEQGYICCYCNRQITADENTKIEHFFPKGIPDYLINTFDYNNLFASCDGFQKTPSPRETSCDTKKMAQLLPISPIDESIETHFDFTLDGQVIGLTEIGKEMIRILGLNIQKLIEFRKVSIKHAVFIDPFSDSFSDSNFKSQEDAEQEIEWLQNLHDGKYEEFSVAMIKVLQNEILNR